MDNTTKYQELLTALGKSFDREVVYEPTFLDGVPSGSYIALQIGVGAELSPSMVEEIEGFNSWSMSIARSHLREGQPLCVATCKLRPLVVGAYDSVDTDMITTACDSYELVPA